MQYSIKIGPSFQAEVASAGISGLWLSYDQDAGRLWTNPGFDESKRAALEAIVVAHDPQKPDPKSAIFAQIADLESTITPRRVREALLGADNGWLADVDAQIAALRGQL